MNDENVARQEGPLECLVGQQRPGHKTSVKCPYCSRWITTWAHRCGETSKVTELMSRITDETVARVKEIFKRPNAGLTGERSESELKP